MREALVQLGLPEYKKWKLVSLGMPCETVSSKTAGKEVPAPSAIPDTVLQCAANVNAKALLLPANDPLRYSTAPDVSQDVQRHLILALETGGIATEFLENPWLRKAFATVGLDVPHKTTGHTMIKMEAGRALKDLVQEMKDIFGWL